MQTKFAFSFIITALFFTSIAFAQGGGGWEGPPQGLRGSDMGGLGKPSNYIELKGVDGISPDSIIGGGVRANIVAIDQKPDLFQIGLRAHELHFQKPELIGNTNQAYAQSLWSTEVSLGYTHTLENQNEWGVNFSFGSDSDQPFDSIRDMTFSVTGIYKKKVDALHSWVFFLNYSPDRAFAPNVPLPGAGYLSINPANHTVLFLGIPFFFGWQPTPDLGFKVSYFIPTIISMEWNYRIFNQAKAYVGFDWVPESWWRSDRDVSTSQIIFDRKKALIGVKSPIFDHYFLNVYGGFFFDEKLFEAKSLTSTEIEKERVPNQAAIGADIAFQF